MNRILLLVLLALLAVVPAFAVGLSPASSSVDYQAGAVVTGQIKVFGEGEIVLTSSDDRLVLDRNVVDKETVVGYSVRMEGFDPGETAITIRASSSGGSGMVTSAARVAAEVVVVREYEGTYAVFDVVAPQPGGDAFYVKIENRGTERISEARTYVDVENERFSSEQTSIRPGEETILKIPVRLDHGSYEYELTVLYDGEVRRETGTFTYGKPDLTYKDFLVQDFSLGGINEFIIVLENRFNRAIDADIDVDLIQDGETIDGFSQEATIEAKSERALSAYLNTNRAVLGEAVLSVQIAYEGVVRTYEELIEIEENDVNAIGRVTGSSGSNVNVILFFVLITVLVNTVLVWLLMRRKK